MIEMVSAYDLQGAIDAAVQAEMARMQAEYENQSIEAAIRRLTKALQT